MSFKIIGSFNVKFHCFVFLFLAVVYTPTASVLADPPADTKKAAAEKTPTDKWTQEWKPLSGKWEACQFGGDGEIEIKPNLISMDYGDPITGVRWTGDVLQDNYEFELEGRRMDGFDFFCAVTFPIGKEDKASLVLGGWGGGTVGISSIDDHDASDNETTMYRDFKNEIWYKARVRVEESRISVWLDDVLQFEYPRKDHRFDIRGEMDPCLPLGLANFQCKSEIKNFRVRALSKSELGEKLKSKKPSKKKPSTDKSAEQEGGTASKDSVKEAVAK